MRVLRMACVLLLSLFAFGCFEAAATQADDDSPVVIEMSHATVTKNQFNERFQVALHLLTRQQGTTPSEQPQAAVERLRAQYLEKYGAELAMLKEAEQRAIEMTQEDVDAALDDMFSTPEDLAYFIEALREHVGEPEAMLREIVRDEATIQLLAEKLLEEIRVPPGDVMTIHHDNQEWLATPEEACVRHIQLESQEEAKRLIEALEQGADFSKLAEQHTNDETGAVDLGCLEKGQLAELAEFEEAVFSARRAGLRGPVQSRFGFHIIDVYEYRASRVPTLNEAYAEIERELALEELPERIGALVSNSGLQVYPERLTRDSER